MCSPSCEENLCLLLQHTQASPQEDSLPCALVTLLRAAADASEGAPQQKPKSQERNAVAEETGLDVAGQQPMSEWMMDLATQLSLQVRHWLITRCWLCGLL
jgi:hypothetical protein